ncbi:MAG TPA: hypothetical protein VF469_12680 [Kofleriaceae bacterium]
MRLPVEQRAATATVGNFPSPRFGWSVTAGGVLGGQIDGRDVSGGATLVGTLSWLPVYERPSRPFVAATASFGGGFARALSDDQMTHSYWALDARGGVTVGKTFAGRWVPYASARAFAGPVHWQHAGASVSGNDRYHFTVGGGLIVRLPRSVDATLEGMPLGEKSVALGVTLHL